ncbi:MAG: diacylglycerol kinase family protein [Pseudomonadota bacterium]|nr:diacylglycerol kinase family protein [Pseudomonadota bacterium]
MKMVKYYLAGAILAFALGFLVPWWPAVVVLWWSGFSLAAVSLAYIANYPALFRKREDGSIPFYIRWIFIPFLLGTGAYNAWARKYDKVPPIQKIEPQLYLACRLSGSDVAALKEEGVDAILDVTAEFDGLDWSAYQYDCAYLNIPVLDHTSPTPEQLTTAINWIQQQTSAGKKVVVHCALGRGRSVLTVAAWLLAKDQTLSVMDAMNQIQSVRETARLNKKQLAALKSVKSGGRLKLTRTLCLIANPVAGGGKWEQEKEHILSELNPHFRVTVNETTPECSATELAEKALNEGTDIIVACGGDGTVTEVASVCTDNRAVLGVIPLGTANALSQVFHGYISKLMPIQTACDVIIDGHTRAVDTAMCNGELMLLVAAVGFEQEMIASADREEKNEGGQMAYLRGLWQAISANTDMKLEVSFDNGETETITTPSFVIANAAPVTTALAQGGDEPDVTDGKLDITWLTSQEDSETQFLSLAELIFTTKTSKQNSGRIKHRQVKSITVTLPEQASYAIDGEIREADKLEVQAIPGNLTVLTARD